MVRVTWLVHRDYIDRVLYALGTLKTFQFISTRSSDEETAEQPDQTESERLEPLRSRVSSLASTLRLSENHRPKNPVIVSYRELDAYISNEAGKISSVEEKVSRIQSSSRAERGVSEEKPRARFRAKNLEIRTIELAETEGINVLSVSEALEAQRQVSEQKQEMRRTGDTYIFEGWIPRNRLDETLAVVKKSSEGFADTIRIQLAPSRPDKNETAETPPTLLRYQRFTQVFDIFASLGRAFGLPSYYEIDPTIFFLVSFPLIFGMMYGDIGHGILLLAGALILYRLKSRTVVRPGSITGYALLGSPLLILCALSSIVFGFLYGEVFGSLDWFKTLTELSGPIWFSPADSMSRLLRYAIYIGIIQISFGLFLGALNKILQGNWKGAISGPIVWLWLYLSGSYLVVRYGFKVFTVAFDPATFGVFIAAPLVVMLLLRVLWSGPLGINETVESLLVSFSHSVSYVRILALKLVGTIFSALLLPANIVGVAPFVVGTVALILFFETLLVFLHTLRLHWIEWFSKFYEGTGKQFMPFGIKSDYVRIE